MIRNSIRVLVLLLAACSASPTPSTPEQRLWATATLDLVTVAVSAAQTAGRITPAQFETATIQLAQLRQVVASSETTPVAWQSVLTQIAAMAIAWIPPQKPK